MNHNSSQSPPERALLISVFVFLLLWKAMDFPLAEGRVVLEMRPNHGPGRSGGRLHQGVTLSSTKESGPSPGGGHGDVEARPPTRRGTDSSGPSPGIGHKYVAGTRH
ncbi:hypothetical protein MLD38_029023 [Melastoma candidum]|uniref:Uncharacterized protein n=1 Tax=Melastoma candidum TaxID=119954 RepID=A0ACB9N8G0_9MYRT|nr:hypothetical protein MLD38_029023 [Melastoma candidum]